MSEAVAEEHPLITAVRPLVEKIAGGLVAADALGPGDVPLLWFGTVVGGVRLSNGDPVSDLSQLLDELAEEMGSALQELDRPSRQKAVRLLEERGAFNYRRSAETVAEALGVTRFTVYNYLNRVRSQ